ncbi:ABC transporter permease [Halonatronum saccharophilum]|uniref:ABC transporter permease n=1 Tax=Halonatronum saccharophilum TaxID=150060 RepID=UPI000483523C|nr:ABC transporter permease [Halonatronum saccharophilum]
MWFEFKVAVRFLKSGKTQTLLILLGITIGVMVQVFLGSLIQGLQKSLVNQTVGNAPHITIIPQEKGPENLISPRGEEGFRIITFDSNRGGIGRWRSLEEYLKKVDGIKAVSPTIDGSAFALRGQKSLSVIIRGVDINAADQIYDISDRIEAGDPTLGGNNILIGNELAKELNLSVGDNLNINTSMGIDDNFIIAGIFDLRSKDLNKSWIIISRDRAQTLFDLPDQVSNIELQIKDVFTANDIANIIMSENTNINAESWQKNNQQLLTALRSQGSSSLIIQIFVIIAVTLGIASVLAVSVLQKSRQIGILKAMGITSSRVGLIFLIQGGILGTIGSIIGTAGGIGLSQLFVNLVRDEMGNPLFPIDIDIAFILISISIAILAGMIAALIPARNSAKLNPVEVINNG